MKLTFNRQVNLCFILVLLGNILSTILKHWVYRNIGYFLCGLIWIIHPVLANGQEPTEKEQRLIRILGGGTLILIALFTRSYVY